MALEVNLKTGDGIANFIEIIAANKFQTLRNRRDTVSRRTSTHKWISVDHRDPRLCLHCNRLIWFPVNDGVSCTGKKNNNKKKKKMKNIFKKFSFIYAQK
jgi:hypothetical protein